MIEMSQELKRIVGSAKGRLLSIPERTAAHKPYPDKWAIKEILGHLIDSAANNHQRFVRMQEVSDLGKSGHAQQHWVDAQHYVTEPWADLIHLWYQYNSHLVHVIANITPESLLHTCDMGYAKPATLQFVVEDYIRHVEHHLKQIFEEGDIRTRTEWVGGSPEFSQE